jgi:long-chain fatty acid transport protein
MRVTITVAVAVLFVGRYAHAGGYHVDEQDARATGRAGAVTANPFNASSIYYNPAGIAAIGGLEINVGGSLVAPTASFRSVTTGVLTDADDKVSVIPLDYVTYRFGDLIGVGVGFYDPFGLALKWPETSPGRQIARETELRSYFISPTAAIDMSRWAPGLQIGAQLNLVPASVRVTRDVLLGSEFGGAALSGTAFGVGASGGVLYRPTGLKFMSFGVTYRSPVKLNVEGDVNFTASSVYRAQLPPDGTAKFSFTLPQTLDFGVAVDFVPEWELEVDVDWTGWSTFQTTRIELPANQVTESRRNWHDTATIRTGTEYLIANTVAVRAGVVWDRTPVPPETLDFVQPDANRLDLCLGVGGPFTKAIRGDIGAIYIPPTQQTTATSDPFRPPVKGTYEVSTFVLTGTVGIHLDSL